MARWNPRINQKGTGGGPPPPDPCEHCLKPLEAPLDIYVSAVNGNDANDGLTPGTAIQTYDHAVELAMEWTFIPEFAGAPGILIHFGSGTYTIGKTLGPQLLGSGIMVYGDGAGQPGDDGFTELVGPSAAQAGSGTQVVVTSGGMGVNAYRGKTIEILTGAAAGDRRTIRDNTAANIVPVRNFSAAVGAGDDYRIVEPAVVMEPPAFNFLNPSGVPFLLGEGYEGDTEAVAGLGASPCVYVANVRFQSPENASSRLWIVGASVAMFGCEIHQGSGARVYLVAPPGGSISIGQDQTFRCMAVWPSDWGLAASPTAWSGWGVGGNSGFWALSSYANRVVGFVVGVGVSAAPLAIISQGYVRLSGGALVNDATSGAGIALYVSGAVVDVGGSTVAPPVVVRSSRNAAASMVVRSFGDGRVNLLSGTSVQKANQGFGAVAEGGGTATGIGSLPGQIGVAAGVEFVGETAVTPPTNALVACGGGVVSVGNGTVFSGWATGTQLAVRRGVPPGTIVQQIDYGLLVAGDSVPTMPGQCTWCINGLLSLFTLGTPSTFSAATLIDGIREMRRFAILDQIKLTQLIPGASGTTTVELWRVRAGTPTLLGTMSVTSADGALGQATLIPATTALRTLNTGDLLGVQMTAIQQGAPQNITIEVLGDVDGRYGRILRV